MGSTNGCEVRERVIQKGQNHTLTKQVIRFERSDVPTGLYQLLGESEFKQARFNFNVPRSPSRKRRKEEREGEGPLSPRRENASPEKMRCVFDLLWSDTCLIIKVPEKPG